MSWITQTDAQTRSGITITDYATASQFMDWAITEGICICVSYAPSSVELYNNNGIYLRQRQTNKVFEFRGLERDFAQELALLLTHDNTKDWWYYAIDTNGDTQTIRVKEGFEDSSKKSVYYKKGSLNTWINGGSSIVPRQSEDLLVQIGQANRSNEADGWRVSLSVTEFEHIPYNAGNNRAGGVWFVPIVPADSKLAKIVSHTHNKQFVAMDGTNNVYQHEEVYVKEYDYLTEEEADAKVTSESASNSRVGIISVRVTWGSTTATKDVQIRAGATATTHATDKVATSRFLGDDKMWSVTVTETTYWTGTT